MSGRTDTEQIVDQCEYCDRTKFGGACLHENPCPAWEAFKEEEEAMGAEERG